MADKKPAGHYDTLYEIDSRFQSTEDELHMRHKPTETGKRRIGLGLVGLGRMGRIHLYNITRNPRAKLLALFDVDQERLRYSDERFFLNQSGVKLAHDEAGWRAMLANDQIEAVIVCSPTQTHEKYVSEALQAGKHVLCEKPLAKEAEAVRQLVKLAEDRGLTLICAFNRRYDPSFRLLKQQVRRGDIGPPRVIKTCSRDSPLPTMEYIATSGGLFHDCYVHDLDALLWVANELPVEAFTTVHCYDDRIVKLNDFDTAVIVLKFPSGNMAVTDLSRHSNAGYEQRMEVFGPKGVLKLDEITSSGWEKHNEHGITKPNQCFSFASRYTEAYANELTELFNHMEGLPVLEKTNPLHLDIVNRIASACEKSAREGIAVSLNWSAEDLKWSSYN